MTTEVSRLPGVPEVRVDPAEARMVVRSEEPLPVDAVRAAIDDAGYALVEA